MLEMHVKNEDNRNEENCEIIMKLISNKTNMCSDEFLSEMDSTLRKMSSHFG